VCMKTGLFENVAHRRGGGVPGLKTGGYMSPPSLRTARRGECGAVGGKYKKNPVRRARERGDTKVADPRCGYASADARLRGRLS
jgi:hypothetical protein